MARCVVKTDDMVLEKEVLKSVRLKEMVDAVISMLDCTQQALIDEDLDKATSVFVKDGLVDEINADATKVLSDYIKQHPDSTLACLNLVGVFRKLERAGDHITNIAEEIVFFIDAKVLKHNHNSIE